MSINRIALVADVADWAFHRIAKALRLYQPKDLNFEIFLASESNLKELHNFLDTKFDLVHYFWRLIPLHIQKKRAFVTTSIYDHQFLDDKKLTIEILSSVDGIYASSKKLEKLYFEAYEDFLPKNVACCQDGVFLELFNSGKSLRVAEKKLTFLWVGNSKWGENDHKGFNTIFMPFVDLLRSSKYSRDIQFEIVDSTKRKRNFAEMVEVYKRSDVLICTSLNEGTPNPILEISASQKAWISTNVGIVPELAGTLQESFMVERRVEAFVESAIKLIQNPHTVNVLGQENAIQVLEWSWAERSKRHYDFFRKVIQDV